MENDGRPVQVRARKRDLAAVLLGAATLLEALGVAAGQLGPVVGLALKLFGLNS